MNIFICLLFPMHSTNGLQCHLSHIHISRNTWAHFWILWSFICLFLQRLQIFFLTFVLCIVYFSVLRIKNVFHYDFFFLFPMRFLKYFQFSNVESFMSYPFVIDFFFKACSVVSNLGFCATSSLKFKNCFVASRLVFQLLLE